MSVNTHIQEVKFNNWRHGLLDIGGRNRMINFRRTRRTTLKLTEPSFEDLYRRIAVAEETITFKRRVDTGSDVKLAGLFYMLDKVGTPVELSVGEIGSDLPTEEMGITLKNLRSRAKLSREEQGINTLYLCFGFLEWRRKPSDPPMLSPLVMVPVTVELSSISSPFTIRRIDEDTVLNPTLEHVLSSEYGIGLPDVDAAGDDIEALMAGIEKTVEPLGWRVIREANLCLLSFLKIVMYKDLAKYREQIFLNPVISALCGDNSGLSQIGPQSRVFDHDSVPCEESNLVVNADASQQDAIALAREGVSFVLQGPPGTGKSQTITNIIADALANGKKVLFVSEKMAALSVVYRRLQDVGLEKYCLSLHNYKAEKKGVIQDLVNTLDAPVRELRPGVSDFLEEMEEERSELNRYFDEMDARREPLGISIYEAISQVAQMEDTRFYKATELVGNVSDRQLRRRIAALRKLEAFANVYDGDLRKNPWRNTAITSVTYELRSYIDQTLSRLGTVVFGADSVMLLAAGARETLSGSGKAEAGAEAGRQFTWKDYRDQCGALHKAMLFESLKKLVAERFGSRFVLPKEADGAEKALGELAAIVGCVDSFNALTGKKLDYSPESLRQIRGFMEFLCRPHNLPENWMRDCTADELRKIASSVRQSQAELEEWKRRLETEWTEEFLDLDAARLLHKFRTDYRTVFKWLRQDYRDDVRLISGTRRGLGGVLNDADCEAALTALKSFQEMRNRVLELERKAARILGTCFRGGETDWNLVGAMIDELAARREYEKLYGLGEAERNLLGREAGERSEVKIGDRTAREWISEGGIEFLAGSSVFRENIGAAKAPENASADRAGYGVSSAGSAAKAPENASVADENTAAELFELFEDYLDHEMVERTAQILAEKIGSGEREFKAAFADAMTACDDAAVGDVYFRCLCAWFPGEDLENVPLGVLSDRITACSDPEKLTSWIDYADLLGACRKEGLEDYIEYVEETGERDIVNVYRKGFLVKWIMECLVDNGISNLMRFQPLLHENTIACFKENDEKALALARARLTQILSGQKPAGVGRMTGAMDEIALLRKESEKRSRVMPLRKLFKAIPTLLMKLKPCFMMSPLSVSYFLDSDLYRFDLVIFDEASQILPEDAIGAIYRGKQVVIAGDTRQMPPTNFFTAVGSSEEFDKDEEEEILVDADSESILDEAGACLPACTLLWHYRSKDESLIAFSNKRIYNNRLITFPGTGKARDSGLEYVYVPGGCYHDRSNVMEARRCVRLLEEHIKEHPERSLGIIAFSEKQQSVIEEAVNDFRLNNPAYEGFFDENKEEPFFVKNLENVQGDERDTIMFSICYARNSQGKMYMRFGPLGAAGGERRLNVAITRAKYNVKLVGSILPTDIDLSRTEAEGVRLLREYIYYAMQNDSGILYGTDDKETDNRFADVVADFIRRSGFEVRREIGQSDYKLDIAVLHPDAPGTYMAGIECDGENYTMARTARDRDVLRRTVMKEMGWNLHHVWAFNWFRNTVQEKERLLAFLRDAMKNRTAPGEDGPKERDSEENAAGARMGEDLVIEREAPAQEQRLEFERYRTSDPMKAPDLPGAGIRQKLAAKIMYVMEAEAPIHKEIFYKRLAPVFGNRKVTALVKRSLDDCVSGLLADRITERGEFLYLTGQADGHFRIRARVPADGQQPRAIEHICDEEIKDAIREIVTSALGLSTQDLIAEAARSFGYARTSSKIRERLRDVCSRMLDEGILREADGKICIRED